MQVVKAKEKEMKDEKEEERQVGALPGMVTLLCVKRNTDKTLETDTSYQR